MRYLIVLLFPLVLFSQAEVSFATLKSEFDSEYATWEAAGTYYNSQSLHMADNGWVAWSSSPASGNVMKRYYDLVWQDGLMSLFQATGTQSYLDDFWTNLKDSRDAGTLDSDRYYGVDSYYDWILYRDPDTTTPTDNAQLYEQRGTRNIYKMLYIMKVYPAIRLLTHPTLGSYQTLYEDYVSFYRLHNFIKWRSRNVGNLFSAATHMTSHWAQSLMYLRELDESNVTIGGYTLEQRQTFYTDFINAYDGTSNWSDWCAVYGACRSGAVSLKAQMRVENGGWVWAGIWGNYTGTNDVSHGQSDVQTIVNMHELLGNFTTEEVQLLTNTLNFLMDSSTDPEAGYSEFPFYLDGTDLRSPLISNGFSMLGRYDQTLQNRLVDVARSNISLMFSGRKAFIGNLALNQAILDDTVTYPLPQTTQTQSTINNVGSATSILIAH